MVGAEEPVDPLRLWTAPAVTSLEEAIFYALSYADVFSYPLTCPEIHRYLVGYRATQEEVAAALDGLALITKRDGYFALPGRDALISLREQRERTAAQMWPRALAYGSAIARLPFVRMVALTGALPMHNVKPDDDFDYLIVTASGRVWLTRMLVIQLIVKPAARRGDEVCPNYIVSEDALALTEHNLFQAHELAQMVPLYGFQVYERLRRENEWTRTFLPNADGPPFETPRCPDLRRPLRGAPELILGAATGTWLEQKWMERLQRKLSCNGEGTEVTLSPDCCKGHVGAHRQGTLEAFTSRLRDGG